MRKLQKLAISLTVLVVVCLLLSSCAQTEAKTKIKALIVPKFEIGEMSGDFPGEAQLFYEHYCAGCEEVAIPNTTPTSHFYVNEKNGVALLVTGSGKTAAGLSLASLLSWDAYDFSDATIVSVGCGGASTGSFVLGDVVVVTAACDAELGHRTDTSELKNPEAKHTWFADESYNAYSCEKMSAELSDHAYELIKDTPLRTTEISQRALAQNFPNEEWASRNPRVAKGSALTGDSYWKGKQGHTDANFIVEQYGCPDEYAVTEMEETAIMNAAECFGLKDKVVSLRVVVNMDTFLKGESPESLWLDDTDFSNMVTEENSETLDIFEPGMENLFDTGRIVIDAVLAGEL
ncbi:MAG: hypothetical protein IKG21_01875 [Atopobiaceae bacterium]|nr:hypothetical protein [Atopobiaceae bacterium]